ncbi:hypothetical protein U3516DRAFT_899432 [Neocallimastix sp. 'constans']
MTSFSRSTINIHKKFFPFLFLLINFIFSNTIDLGITVTTISSTRFKEHRKECEGRMSSGGILNFIFLISINIIIIYSIHSIFRFYIGIYISYFFSTSFFWNKDLFIFLFIIIIISTTPSFCILSLFSKFFTEAYFSFSIQLRKEGKKFHGCRTNNFI